VAEGARAHVILSRLMHRPPIRHIPA
jgi:hypothetical protein